MTAPPPTGPGPLAPPGALRCPRCLAMVGAEQDWCLECGAPARTRLAPTPNWQLPTVAIGAIIVLAGALLAFAFVELTDDDGISAGTTPTAVVETAPVVVAPPIVPTTATTTTTPTTATTTAPAVPSAVPGQTTTAGRGSAAGTATPGAGGTTATPSTGTTPLPERPRTTRTATTKTR